MGVDASSVIKNREKKVFIIYSILKNK